MNQEALGKLMKKYENVSREELVLIACAARAHDEGITPKRVSISKEEMNKIADLMRVFGQYIESHPYFDFIVSSKFGVIRPDVSGCYMFFSDADSLFYRLMDEIFDDVRELKIGGEHMTSLMRTEEEKEVRSRALPLIEKLRDNAHYQKLFETFLDENREE